MKKKIFFQLPPPLTNLQRRKSDLAIKRSKVIATAMLYTKIQPQSFLGSGEEDF